MPASVQLGAARDFGLSDLPTLRWAHGVSLSRVMGAGAASRAPASLHVARSGRFGREHGVWGRQEARSSRSERALDGGGSPALASGRRSKAYRGFESLLAQRMPHRHLQLALRREHSVGRAHSRIRHASIGLGRHLGCFRRPVGGLRRQAIDRRYEYLGPETKRTRESATGRRAPATGVSGFRGWLMCHCDRGYEIARRSWPATLERLVQAAMRGGRRRVATHRPPMIGAGHAGHDGKEK